MEEERCYPAKNRQLRETAPVNSGPFPIYCGIAAGHLAGKEAGLALCRGAQQAQLAHRGFDNVA
jgi:hypothetical protein